MDKKRIKPAHPAPVVLQPVFNFSLTTKYIILGLICLIFYGNSLSNEYALDDNAVVLGNANVQKGVGGISNIMTSDAWNSYLGRTNSNDRLAGGRYRPLSLVFFAVEQSLFGDSPFARHFFNLVFFMGTVFALFYFLSGFLFKKNLRGEDCAFLAALLFAIHPIHTEVVANVKSLDEILSLFFILLTFIFSLKYIQLKKKIDLFFATCSFFLALLSKEYALMLVILLPALFYLFREKKEKTILFYSIPYFITVFIYFLIRYAAVGIHHSQADMMHLNMNNQLRLDPYYLATPIQKFATEWYALGKYLFMLFVPYPLSSDYSYNQISYHNFADATVWASLIAYIGIVYCTYILFRKKDIMAFPVLFYLLMLFPVSNFFINIGAIFAERFDYHASVGFVIIISWLCLYWVNKLNMPIKMLKRVIFVALTGIVLVCAGETINRNQVWKNNFTLFMNDVKVAPNSEFLDDGASVAYINLAMQKGYESRRVQMLDSAAMFCRKAISMDKTFPDLFLNAGLAYYNLANLDSAKYFWDILRQSGNPTPIAKQYQTMLAKTYLILAKRANNAPAAIGILKKGISEDSTVAALWFTLASAYYTLQQFDSAEYAWVKGSVYKSDSAK